MENLVLEYSWGNESCCGTTHICFEYESKDKFVFDVLEKYQNYPWKISSDYFHSEEVEIIKDSVYMTRSEIDSIEKSVYSLDDWFILSKIQVDII